MFSCLLSSKSETYSGKPNFEGMCYLFVSVYRPTWLLSSIINKLSQITQYIGCSIKLLSWFRHVSNFQISNPKTHCIPLYDLQLWIRIQCNSQPHWSDQLLRFRLSEAIRTEQDNRRCSNAHIWHTRHLHGSSDAGSHILWAFQDHRLVSFGNRKHCRR